MGPVRIVGVEWEECELRTVAVQPRGANLNAVLNQKIGGNPRLSEVRVRTANHVFDLALAVYRAQAPRIDPAQEGTMASTSRWPRCRSFSSQRESTTCGFRVATAICVTTRHMLSPHRAMAPIVDSAAIG